MKNRLKFSLTLLLLFIISPSPSIFPEVQRADSELIATYRELSIDTHLNYALFKLEDLLLEVEKAGDTEKLEKLRGASVLLWKSLQQYEYYRTGDPKFLAEDWLQHYNWMPGTAPDFPSVSNSPLSLLEHLRSAHYHAQQSSGQIMVASRQYTEAEQKLIDALDEAVDLIDETIRAIEQSRGWLIHLNPNFGINISAPPGYKKNEREKPYPLDLVKYKPDGAPEKAVYVSFQKAEGYPTPDKYVEGRLAELRKRFPDLSDFQQEETTGSSGYFSTSFTYSYTWEGDLIKALISVKASGERATEIGCLSIAEYFDREEFDEIIKSYLR
ncbi:hypothetical protein ACFLT9_03525 [Acidobacteriota bacterium]